MQHYSGSELSPVAAIQTLMGDRKRLRQMQRISGHSIPIAGSEWVEEFTTLVRRSVAPSGSPNYSGNVFCSVRRNSGLCGYDNSG